ncbi:unnamed protein product [Boreogadus saida]
MKQNEEWPPGKVLAAVGQRKLAEGEAFDWFLLTQSGYSDQTCPNSACCAGWTDTTFRNTSRKKAEANGIRDIQRSIGGATTAKFSGLGACESTEGLGEAKPERREGVVIVNALCPLCDKTSPQKGIASSAGVFSATTAPLCALLRPCADPAHRPTDPPGAARRLALD